MSGLGEQLNGGKKQGREIVSSGMKTPFVEKGGIEQAHLWQKDKEFDFGLTCQVLEIQVELSSIHLEMRV